MVKKKIVKMLSRRHGSVPNLQVSTALDRVREQSSSQFTVQFIFFFFGCSDLPAPPGSLDFMSPTSHSASNVKPQWGASRPQVPSLFPF